jgi:hypothetical protein
LEIVRTRRDAVNLSKGNKQFLVSWEARGITFDYLCRALGLDTFLMQIRLGERIRGQFHDKTRGKDPEQRRRWESGRVQLFQTLDNDSQSQSEHLAAQRPPAPTGGHSIGNS